MSKFCELDCGGEQVTLERTDDGDIIFHNWDEETELAAVELGFEPSACLIVWNAINYDELDVELREQASGDSVSLVEALFFAGADVNSKGINNWTPLHYAARFGRTDVVKFLLKARASVHAIDEDGDTPLHIAAQWGKTDVVKVLLTAKAGVNTEGNRKLTPLHLAARWGEANIAKVLLEAGASVAANNCNSCTPLQLAKRFDRSNVAKILEDWIAEHEK